MTDYSIVENLSKEQTLELYEDILNSGSFLGACTSRNYWYVICTNGREGYNTMWSRWQCSADIKCPNLAYGSTPALDYCGSTYAGKACWN